MEHRILRQFLTRNSSVLEIGGRLGTLTCDVAKIQQNSGKLVTAEADRVGKELHDKGSSVAKLCFQEIWSILHHNQIIHECSFTILMGIISNAPFAISTTPEGDRIMTLATSHEDDNVIKIDHEIKEDETDQKDGGEPFHEEEQEISSISFRKLEEKMGFAVRTKVTKY